MGRHKKPDKLSQEASAALAAGMSYGKWKAMQTPVEVKSKPKLGATHICEYCGEKFIQYDHIRRKYCCEAHREAANNKKGRERKAVKVKTCAQCGKQFTPASGHFKYCGEQCAQRAHARLIRERQQRKALQGG